MERTAQLQSSEGRRKTTGGKRPGELPAVGTHACMGSRACKHTSGSSTFEAWESTPLLRFPRPTNAQTCVHTWITTVGGSGKVWEGVPPLRPKPCCREGATPEPTLQYFHRKEGDKQTSV